LGCRSTSCPVHAGACAREDEPRSLMCVTDSELPVDPVD
jgi:hypothetical protein